MSAEAMADALADELVCASHVVEGELILGVGVDIESPLAVMRSHAVGGRRWLARLFTPDEASEADDALRTSSRFVAKEAVAKSLRTGFRLGIAGRHIEVLMEPHVMLHGPAAQHAEQLGVKRCLVLSAQAHGGVCAVALAIADARRNFEPDDHPLEEDDECQPR
jgi:phosphopantetheine--protein transferase-like protein